MNTTLLPAAPHVTEDGKTLFMTVTPPHDYKIDSPRPT